MKRLLVLTFLLILNVFIVNSQIVINEIATSNGGSYYDEDGKTPDWLELYNKADTAINIGGWRIYDKPELGKAFILPDTIIPPKGYLLVHCSGKNKITRNNTIIRSSGYGIVHYSVFDEFSYFYVPTEGDFEMLVNLRSLKPASFFDKAGVMFREELHPSSKYYGLFGQAKYLFKYRFQARTEIDKFPEDFVSNYGLNYPNAYLRLSRTQDKIYTIITDHTGFPIEYKEYDYPIGKKLYAGIAVSAMRRNEFMKAVIGTIKLNGKYISIDDLEFTQVGEFPKGEVYRGGEIHTQFKLSSSGGTAYLWNNAGELVNKMQFGEIGTDYSFGRSADDEKLKLIFGKPTPAMPNGVGYLSVLKPPKVEVPSGWYDEPVWVALSHQDPNANIYYTLDGSEVSEHFSTRYVGASIRIEKNTSLRVKAFRRGHLPSATLTYNYFINDSLNLPVLAVTADHEQLFGTYGIFSELMTYVLEEIPVNFHFWEDTSKPAFQSNSGMRLTGETSRLMPQKPFRLYARDRYGSDNFEYSFFDKESPKLYRKLWLRTASNDFSLTMIRDVSVNAMMEHSEALNVPNSRACVVYLNGEYWGIYFLKEFIDEELLQDKFGVDKDDIDIIERWNIARTGSSHNFQELVKLFNNTDMTSSDAYTIIENNIDVDNIIDYLSIQFFACNIDWGEKNVKQWRSESFDGKWRWIMHDLDMTFFHHTAHLNSFDILYSDGSIIGEVSKHLFQNIEFRYKFMNRCADLLNSYLHRDRANEIIDSLAAIIAPEIDRHRVRWGEPVYWDVELGYARDFINLRADHLRMHIINEFELSGYYPLYIQRQDTTNCALKINSIVVKDSVWRGYYFNDIPITITAIPEFGYELLSWGNDSLDNKTVIDVASDDNLFLFPIFIRRSAVEFQNLVINEIMYKSPVSFNSGDWVEIYNPNNLDIDLSGWTIKDDKNSNSFTIPQGTIIKSNGYLVVAENLTDFENIHLNVKNVVGSFGFGLSSNGDQVRLFDRTGRLQDSVQYYSSYPWDPKANGTGFSLELIDYALDNNLPTSWQASYKLLGTPGEKNSAYSSIFPNYDYKQNISVYPNPATNFLNVKYYGDEIQTLEILNTNGRTLARFDLSNNLSNHYQIDCSAIPAGRYFIRIISRNRIDMAPFNIIR